MDSMTSTDASAVHDSSSVDMATAVDALDVPDSHSADAGHADLGNSDIVDASPADAGGGIRCPAGAAFIHAGTFLMGDDARDDAGVA